MLYVAFIRLYTKVNPHVVPILRFHRYLPFWFDAFVIEVRARVSTYAYKYKMLECRNYLPVLCAILYFYQQVFCRNQHIYSFLTHSCSSTIVWISS